MLNKALNKKKLREKIKTERELRRVFYGRTGIFQNVVFHF
jgi:hypothetical protein